MSSVAQRFLRYIAIDTQSDNQSQTLPSSEGQWDLARLLAEELRELGLSDVMVTSDCFVHGRLPANRHNGGPVIGLVGHLDTYPDFNGRHINPKIQRNYDGAVITLNAVNHMMLSPDVFPELLNYKGHDIITTDGTSLLGTNGKAGIAEIMAALELLTANADMPHGEIRVVFTPDQETDRSGIENLDLKLFPVDFALTVDGDGLGEINFENFNAAHGILSISGRSVFTGAAKNKLINAGRIAAEWIDQLPADETPENTEGYEGFFHIEHFSGTVEKAEVQCMIRDFELEGFMRRKAFLHKITEQMNQKYGDNVLKLTIRDDYFNMRSALESKPKLTAAILNIVSASGILPKVLPIRGGSDGATLAAMGIPTPNLFTGGYNCHGPYEFISIQAMEATTTVILNTICFFAESTEPWN